MPNEPIKYLDSILQEEELRWRMEEYGHDRRQYSISRSGRYKSINKKRDAIRPDLFKGADSEKATRQSNTRDSHSSHHHQQMHQSAQQQYQYQQQQTSYTRARDRDEKFKYYETNL